MSDAVLLVNLGTPDAPTAPAVRRYLGEFLSDPRVVALPRWLWLPLLRLVILPRRSARVAHKYAAVWLPGGSPLAVYTRGLAEGVAARLPGIRVEHAMRYGAPALAGTAETKFLNGLAGTWAGSGTVKGPDSGGIDCTITFTASGGGVAFNGKCLTDLGPPQITRGSIAYNDAAKRYEATSKGQVAIGKKSGGAVTFVINLKDPMIGTGTSTLKIAASQIVAR